MSNLSMRDTIKGSLAIGKIGGISECKKNVYVGESPEEYTEVWFEPSEEGIIDEVATKKFVEERTVKLETSLDNIENRVETLESNSGGSGSDLNLRDVGDGEIFTIDGVVTPTVTYGQIVLSKTSTTITEGGTDTFTVKLDKAPTNNQVVNISKNNSDVTLSTTSLTFTPTNYSTAQSVTVTVAQDDTDYSNETCVITCTSANVSTKTLTVNIADNDTPPSNISVTGVTLDKTSHSFKVGETVQLTPTILPSNATNKNVVWAASNENCTVTGGLVTAVKEGECVITCQTVDGSYKATCSITVQANSNANIVSDYYKQWNNITAVTTAGNDDDIIRDNKDFTIFAKIENPTGESNPAFGIISNWNISGKQSYQFYKNWQGKIIFQALGVSGNISLETTETFSDKGVSFISCVRSGLSLTIYVNNVEITSMTIASTFVFKDTQDVIKLGHASKTLHTLLYYNRALTQEELTKNYNALGGV